MNPVASGTDRLTCLFLKQVVLNLPTAQKLQLPGSIFEAAVIPLILGHLLSVSDGGSILRRGHLNHPDGVPPRPSKSDRNPIPNDPVLVTPGRKK